MDQQDQPAIGTYFETEISETGIAPIPRKKKKRQAGLALSTSSAQLFVSLYLVILAFFIVLNSMAKIQEERTSTVIQSIKSTFKTEQQDAASFIRISEPIGSNIAVTSFNSRVKSIAEDVLQISKSKIIQRGDQLEILVQAEQIFIKNERKLRSDSTQFINKLANEIAKLESGQRIDSEFVFGAPTSNVFLDAQTNLTFARTGVVARKLESVGIPSETLYIGMTKALNANEIRIRFYERSVDSENVIPEGFDAN